MQIMLCFFFYLRMFLECQLFVVLLQREEGVLNID